MKSAIQALQAEIRALRQALKYSHLGLAELSHQLEASERRIERLCATAITLTKGKKK